MMVVIQCAARKVPNAGFLRTDEGKKVFFVADPAAAPDNDEHVYARPDDLSSNGRTWRQIVTEHNYAPSNSTHLLPAYELYQNPVYRRLVERLGIGQVFILSAGWGLIRASFLTPFYDITFSQSVKKDEPYKFRGKRDTFQDFCQLPRDTSDQIIFFGGKDYLSLFGSMIAGYASRAIIFYNSESVPELSGCTPIRFKTTTRTNWHYECANAFLDGKVVI